MIVVRLVSERVSRRTVQELAALLNTTRDTAPSTVEVPESDLPGVAGGFCYHRDHRSAKSLRESRLSPCPAVEFGAGRDRMGMPKWRHDE